jgi:putative methionine-R-sulfoxide reductase with GAF domain
VPADDLEVGELLEGPGQDQAQHVDAGLVVPAPADHDLKSLFVVAYHGYASGVGAEIAVGDGVIGVAAQRRRQVLVSHVTRTQALYRAAARSRTEERHEIPLPGLAGAQSVVATPILLRGRLMGVLYVDSAEPGRFGTADSQLIDVIARHIGMSIGLLDTTADDLNLSPGPRRAGTKPGAGSGARSVSSSSRRGDPGLQFRPGRNAAPPSRRVSLSMTCPPNKIGTCGRRTSAGPTPIPNR